MLQENFVMLCAAQTSQGRYLPSQKTGWCWREDHPITGLHVLCLTRHSPLSPGRDKFLPHAKKPLVIDTGMKQGGISMLETWENQP